MTDYRRVFDPENKPSIQSFLNSGLTVKWGKYIFMHRTMTSLYKRAMGPEPNK